MKILLGTHLFFPHFTAGTEVLTLELARALRNKGHVVYVLTCFRHQNIEASTKPWLTTEEYDLFKVYVLNFGVAGAIDAVEPHFRASSRIALIKELVKTLSPDIVHFMHLNGVSAAAISEIKKMGIPVFFTATDYWTICPKTSLLTSRGNTCKGPAPGNCLQCAKPALPIWVTRLVVACAQPQIKFFSRTMAQVCSLKVRTKLMADNVNAADAVFVGTNFLAKLLIQYGVKEQITKLVSHGIQLGTVPKRIVVPASFSPSHPFELVFVGSFTPIKGLHIILQALQSLPTAKRECLHLSIYGKPSTGESDYVELIEKLALTLKNTVSFMGTFPHNQIGRVLSGAHVCLVPSIWYENAPLVLCSSLAVGTPVIISNMGGMTEVVKEGIDGFSFPVGDAVELSNLIARLLDNPAWFSQAAQQPRHRYRTHEDYANDIEAEYMKVSG